MKEEMQVNSEQEFRQFLDGIDEEIKILGRRKGIAGFHRLLGEEHENLEVLNDKFGGIFLDENNRKIIETWKKSVCDSRLKRRAEIFSRAFLSSQVEINPDLFRITDPLEKRIVEFQPELNGKRISRSEHGEILEVEPDRLIREKAYYAGKVIDDDIEKDVLKLFEERNRLAQKLGYKDFVALGLELQDLNEDELRTLFEQVKSTTQEVWDDVLVQAAKTLGVEKLESWDLSYYLHSKLPAPPNHKFPKTKIIPTFKKALKAAGGDLDALPIQVFEHDIPYGGLCMGIEMGKDIRILANPRDGIMGYDILFHEFGHGIHSSLMDTSSYMVAVGDPPFFWEGIAGMFEWIIYDPRFLKENFNLSEDEIQNIQHRTQMSRIAWFRRIAVSCMVEWAAYRGDPNPRKTAADLAEEYVGVRPPKDAGWAGNTLFTTHPLYSQNYLLMDVMAFQTISAYREKYGEYPGPHLFDFVKEQYIEPVAWVPWRNKILKTTGEPLSAKALGEYLSS